MPQIPIIVSRQGLSPQAFNSPPPSAFGAGIGEELQRSGQVFERIQQGYDAVESAKIIGEGNAALVGVLQHAKLNISDPEEYAKYTKDNLDKVYNDTLDAVPNEAVKRRVQAALSDNKANADLQAKYGLFEKKKDVAEGHAFDEGERLKDAAVAAPDPQTRQGAMNQYAKLQGELKAAGFIDAKELQGRLERFNDRVIGDGMALYARRDPLQFGDNVDQGKLLEMFPGANATQIQKATEIADRTLSIAQAKEKQQLADESRDIKLSAYDQARKQQLSDSRIDDMQKIYHWTDDTANELKRINRGLKEDSPIKEQLITRAMESLAKGSPSLTDVTVAERELNRLVGTGQISADSTEFKRAMNQVKNERRSLTIQNDINANQAQRNANQAYSADRQRAADILKRPGLDPDQRMQLQGEINRKLDTLRNDPAGRTKVLQDVEKQMEDRFNQQQNWKPKTDALRSLKK